MQCFTFFLCLKVEGLLPAITQLLRSSYSTVVYKIPLDQLPLKDVILHFHLWGVLQMGKKLPPPPPFVCPYEAFFAT